MKKQVNEILSLFNERSPDARVSISPEDLNSKIDALSNLPKDQIPAALAELYFKYNPNVYAGGNNARLYTRPEPEALLGAFIALLGNNSGGTFKSNPVGSIMTKSAFDFCIYDLIGYEKGEAIDTSGGMAANAMAIHIAKYKFNKEVKEKGNAGMKFVLLTSDQSHYSEEGAVNRAGLGIDNIQFITTNPDGSMNLAELEKALQHYPAAGYCTVVASTFGTTVLGAFDDIDAISNLCYQYGATWHHIDASWGGPVAISKYAKDFGSLSKADSVTLDYHKAFKSTLTCGLFVTKHAGILAKANASRQAEKYLYLNGVNKLDNGVRSLECGKADRVLPFATLLMSRKKEGLSEMINRDLARAKHFAQIIDNFDDFILMHEPRYLNVCIQVASPFFENVSHSDFTEIAQSVLLERDSSGVMIELCKDTKSNTQVLRCIMSNPNMDHAAMHAMLQEIVFTKQEIENRITKQKQVS